MEYIKNYRAIAILSVMFVHALSSVKSDNSSFMSFLEVFFDNITILFVVISGYLFAYKSDEFKYFDFLRKRFFSVVVPYIVISFPMILLFILEMKNVHLWLDFDWFNGLSIIGQTGYLLITGAHLAPYWFIPMILFIYLISPIFIWLQKKNLVTYFFIISLVPAIYFGRPVHNVNILMCFIYFLPAYLFGMVLFNKSYLYTALSKWSLIIWFVFLFVYLSTWYNVNIDSSIDIVFMLLLSISVFSLTYQYLNCTNTVLGKFATYSTFFFFIHGYFSGAIRVAYRTLGFEQEGMLPAVISFAFIVSMSFITLYVVKFIFRSKSRMLFGV